MSCLRRNEKNRYVDVCPYDGLPCSSMIKGVGFGLCIKCSLAGKFRVCCRFSPMSGSRVFDDLVSDKV